MQGSTFRNNQYNGDSHGGGAIFANGGTIEITDSLFENNLGNGNGGGAIASTGDFFSPEVTVIRSTFRNNQTAGDFGNGGAINANGNLTVQASTFSGNQANGSITFGYGNGGGISIINGDLLVENATFSANRANGDGGGVYYRADSSATFNNVTVTANSADAGGGIYSTGDGTGNDAMLNNSLLAGNSASTGPDCFGYMDSFAGHNLIQTASGCPLMGTTTGNILGQNPLLGPLANNGGTTFTHALLAGSPAIDAGDPGASCMPTDQRGVARFDGNYDSIVRCDIGAYEYNTPFTPTPTPTPTPSSSASTAQPVLPNTGFARGRVTHLPMQPVSAAYQSYNDLTLELPTLKVSAPIVGVLKSNSQWDVSWLGNSVGWLEGSAFPTWSGNTVLTGHVWNADNTPGIFADIKTLKYGDRFYVHAFGQTYVYEVRENRLLWSKNNTAAVFKSEKYDWVTLLTCEGYNPLSGNYFFRRMVRAVLVEVR
ncbi:MAG: sortase [Anaerolineales bacterium]